MAAAVARVPSETAITGLTAQEARAFTFLGWFYEAAQHQGRAASIAQWVDPDPPGPDESRPVRDFLLAEAIPRWSGFEIWQKRDLYKQQLLIAMAAVEKASCTAAQALLARQTQQLGQLQAGMLSSAGEISNAASKVRSFLKQQQAELTREQTLEVVNSHGRGKGTVVDRLRRVQYLNAIRVLAAQAPKGSSGPDASRGFRYLRVLMAHPKGVEMVNAFAASPAGGFKAANAVLQQSRDSARALSDDLAKMPGKVWRFRAAIAVGLCALNLHTKEAAVQFSLAWCATRRDPIERVLQIAGNAVMVIGFLGPQGRAVAAVLGLFLAAAETTVSFLKALEQDRAAEATAFASPAEKLSEGASWFETGLLGASTILAAWALHGELSAVTSSAASAERKAAAAAAGKALQKKGGEDLKGILNKGTALDNITTVERETGSLPISSATRRAPSPAAEDILAGVGEGSTVERATASRELQQAERSTAGAGTQETQSALQRARMREREKQRMRSAHWQERQPQQEPLRMAAGEVDRPGSGSVGGASASGPRGGISGATASEDVAAGRTSISDPKATSQRATTGAQRGTGPPARATDATGNTPAASATAGQATKLRAVSGNPVDETVERLLSNRHVPNPPGKGRPLSVEADAKIMDAETRRVLGETYDLKIAGTGGIDTIIARQAPNGEISVTIKGVLLPDQLTRDASKVGGRTRLAPSFNAQGRSSQFAIAELEIRGPKGELVRLQRAHLWGPGFGDEAAAGMFLAPEHVNLVWQNQKVEAYLRDLAAAAGEKGGFVRLEARALSYERDVTLAVGNKGEAFLKRVEYRVELHIPGKPIETRTIGLNVPKPPALDVDVKRLRALNFASAEGGDDLMNYVR